MTNEGRETTEMTTNAEAKHEGDAKGQAMHKVESEGQRKPNFKLPNKITFTKIGIVLLILFLLGLSLRTAGIMREPLVRPDGQLFWAQPDEYGQTEYAEQNANYNFDFGSKGFAKPNASGKVIFSLLFLLLNLLTPIKVTALLILKTSQFFSAFAGSATIIAIYYLGKEMYGKRTGIIAASFFTVFMFNIRLSHYATPYAFTTFMLTLFFIYLYRFCFKDSGEPSDMKRYGPTKLLAALQRGKIQIHRQLFLIGFFWMIAIATSYLSLFFVLAIIMGLGFKYGMFHDLFVKKIVKVNKLFAFFTASFNMFIGFVVSSFIFYPHIYFFPATVWDYFSRMLFEMSGGLYGLRATNGLGFFDLQLVSYMNIYWGIGAIFFVLFVLSIFYFLFRHEKRDILIVSMVVLFAFYMGRKPLNLMRYTSILYPLIAIMIAATFDSLLYRLKHLKFVKLGLYMVIFVAFISGLVFSLAHLSVVTGPDTRQIAGDWMQENIPVGTQIMIGPGGTQPWMMPVTNYGNYQFGPNPEYIIIVESVYKQIDLYLNTDIYQDSDWGERLPTKEAFTFYDQLFKGQLPYELYHTVSTTPKFGSYVIDKSKLPYGLWGTTYPDIRFYKRIEQ